MMPSFDALSMSENNSHYDAVLRLLLDEAEAVIRGCENREHLTKNAATLAMNDDEYKEFLQSLYLSYWDERKALMEQFIEKFTLNCAIRQRYTAMDRTADDIERIMSK